MLCISCVEEFPEAERHGMYCHKCYLDMTAGIKWKDESAPAQEEKGMDRDGVHTGGIKPDNPMGLPPSIGARIVTGFQPRPEEIAEKRIADLRQLHRDAALAALSGVCHDPDLSASEHARYAIAAADEFIRQYNPDAVIAEVVG